MLLGVYDYTVILTYSEMLTAYVGITRALHGDLHNALFCLMISGVCDMFDGKIASTKTDRTFTEKRFGVQIDSLSDLICFGALPAVIVYIASKGSDFGLFASSFYLLCALIRLAWFNCGKTVWRPNRFPQRPDLFWRPSGGDCLHSLQGK